MRQEFSEKTKLAEFLASNVRLEMASRTYQTLKITNRELSFCLRWPWLRWQTWTYEAGTENLLDSPRVGICISFSRPLPGKQCADTPEIRRLRAAVERMSIGVNHIATYRSDAWPPYGSEPLDALETLGAGREYDMWCCWNAAMCARDTLAESRHGI